MPSSKRQNKRPVPLPKSNTSDAKSIKLDPESKSNTDTHVVDRKLQESELKNGNTNVIDCKPEPQFERNNKASFKESFPATLPKATLKMDSPESKLASTNRPAHYRTAPNLTPPSSPPNKSSNSKTSTAASTPRSGPGKKIQWVATCISCTRSALITFSSTNSPPTAQSPPQPAYHATTPPVPLPSSRNRNRGTPASAPSSYPSFPALTYPSRPSSLSPPPSPSSIRQSLALHPSNTDTFIPTLCHDCEERAKHLYHRVEKTPAAPPDSLQHPRLIHADLLRKSAVYRMMQSRFGVAFDEEEGEKVVVRRRDWWRKVVGGDGLRVEYYEVKTSGDDGDPPMLLRNDGISQHSFFGFLGTR